MYPCLSREALATSFVSPSKTEYNQEGMYPPTEALLPEQWVLGRQKQQMSTTGEVLRRDLKYLSAFPFHTSLNLTLSPLGPVCKVFYPLGFSCKVFSSFRASAWGAPATLCKCDWYLRRLTSPPGAWNTGPGCWLKWPWANDFIPQCLSFSIYKVVQNNSTNFIRLFWILKTYCAVCLAISSYLCSHLTYYCTLGKRAPFSGRSAHRLARIPLPLH